MAEWTSVRWGVSISHGNLAVIELAVYEFKYGDTLRRIGVEFLCMARPTICRRAPLSLFATRSRLYQEV